MNIECVICLENLQAAEDIYSTPCGHVFHSPCVSQWFQRSSTCPECRKDVPSKKLNRIFFNFVNENTIMEELTSILESEIDSLKHQLTVKDEAIAQGTVREEALSEKNNRLQDEVDSLRTNMEHCAATVQSAGDAIHDIIKKLGGVFTGYVMEKTLNVPSSVDLSSVE